jgi:hypothetical protein
MASVLYDDQGNPITVVDEGGQKLLGTKAKSVLYDASGNLLPVAGGASVSASTRALVAAGSDGSNARFLSVDSSGHPQVVLSGTNTVQVEGRAAAGATPVGNPVLAGGWDGANVQRLLQKTSAPLSSDLGLVVRNITGVLPTFRVVYDRITMATNKWIATLFNTNSTRKVVMQRFWVYNWQTGKVPGNDCNLGWYKISARTAGTSVTIRSEDSADTLAAGIIADTDSTAVTSDYLITRVMFMGEEIDLAGNEAYNWLAFPGTALRYDRRDGQKGLTLRQNQGVSLQFLDGDADGSISVIYEFTEEAA